ncbi:hypothetical protein [Mycobacterium sp. NAZ190054]|uniref:hypothetical protein n=1 Tax=Mycobacterium sp. NAZ190054 TaxID=1747766 RepID=UPI000ACF2BB6|nr:hypothetical protein [Mycobacterium sp. NAZ190054]
MRNTLAIGTTALALLFGGAGAANATEPVQPASTTTVGAGTPATRPHVPPAPSIRRRA